MSSFFTNPSSQKKRKRAEDASSSSKRRTFSNYQGGSKQERQERKEKEDDISSGESESELDHRDGKELEDSEASSSGEDGETEAERRHRIAQRVLDKTARELVEDPTAFDAADIDRDLIADRLKEDVADSKGKLHRKIGADLSFSTAEHTYFSSNQHMVTAVAICRPHAYTVAKDSSISKWELAEPAVPLPNQPTNVALRKRPTLVKKFKLRHRQRSGLKGHTAAVLCIAASTSGRFLATGGMDKKLVIWDAVTLKPLKEFAQHRDSVLSVSFRRGTHTLFSGSADRTIKIWSLDEMAYIETLHGHQDHVIDVAGMAQERCVSVGARDRTVRLWKVVEENQLVFRGGGSAATRINKSDAMPEQQYTEGSIDRVAVIDEDMFVSGSDNGSISLWSAQRKKPLHTISLAHGLDPQISPEESSAESHPSSVAPGRPMPRWITALATVPLSDLILTGSWDGHVRAWRVSDDKRRLEPLGVVGEAAIEQEISAQALDTASTSPGLAKGVITDISVFERGDRGENGLCVVVAISKEPRLARWKAFKGKNGAIVFEVSWNKDVVNGDGFDDGDVDGVLQYATGNMNGRAIAKVIGMMHKEEPGANGTNGTAVAANGSSSVQRAQ